MSGARYETCRECGLECKQAGRDPVDRLPLPDMQRENTKGGARP